MHQARQNGIRHPKLLKKQAIILRKKGKTHREISKQLNISRGSAHLWTRRIELSQLQKSAIQQRKTKSTFTQERRKMLKQVAKINLVPNLEKHTKESLLIKIKQFYVKNGRMPLKKEFNMYREYKRRFGSWNKAIKLSGFKPNPELFAHKFKATDGHKCDSFTEKIIDDWLHQQKIQHERNYKYGKTKMTADFLIENKIVVEFFGLAGIQKHYDEIIKRKKKISKELGLKLVGLYPKDLFPKSDLERIILPLIK